MATFVSSWSNRMFLLNKAAWCSKFHPVSKSEFSPSSFKTYRANATFLVMKKKMPNLSYPWNFQFTRKSITLWINPIFDSFSLNNNIDPTLVIQGLNDTVFHCFFFNLYLVRTSFLVGLMFPYVASFTWIH